MTLPTHCPRCTADFQAEPIPEAVREHYGSSTHYSRVISIYDIYKDETTQYRCPDCGYVWSRLIDNRTKNEANYTTIHD